MSYCFHLQKGGLRAAGEDSDPSRRDNLMLPPRCIMAPSGRWCEEARAGCEPSKPCIDLREGVLLAFLPRRRGVIIARKIDFRGLWSIDM